MRFATLGAVLAWVIASGCTGGDGAASVDVDDRGGRGASDTADALVELPPAPVLTAAERVAPGTVDRLALGDWRWVAPCRVVAHEVIGTGGPQVARTFTVDVAEDPAGDGVVMSFDDVTEEAAGLTEEYVAEALYRNLAVLPSMRLDADGRFVEFVRLEADLSDVARRAGISTADAVSLMLARQPVVGRTILDRTILGWYGFWLDHDSLPVNPDRLAGEQSRPGPAGTWRWSTETFAAPVVGERDGRVRDGVVWLTHTERAVDSAAGRIDASAIVDPTARRPSYVVLSINGFTTGGLAVFAEQDRRIVTFDWEDADGCE